MKQSQPAPDLIPGKMEHRGGVASPNYRLLAEIPIRLSVEVGSVSLTLNELLDLSEGSVIELNRQSHEMLDIIANGTLIARGEVVTINGRFGVRIVDVVNVEAGAVPIERRQ
jgi:flagellar motor switch protein FliN/FliY